MSATMVAAECIISAPRQKLKNEYGESVHDFQIPDCANPVMAPVRDVANLTALSEAPTALAGLLLSGGASQRMGIDKTRLLVGGRTLAIRTGSILSEVVSSALEIGPGRSLLEAIQEQPPRQGPLAAIVTGWHALRRRGHEGSVLVVACDLPFLEANFLRFLLSVDPAATVLPVVGNRSQPLCAQWGVAALELGSDNYARGERSLRFLSNAPDVVLLHENEWSPHATSAMFVDVDTPDDARRAGLIF